MIIKLNIDLLKYKKGSIIDINKINYREQVYFNKRIKDSKIDNCVSILNKIEKKTNKVDKKTDKKTD